MFNRLKQFRRIATRYDKTARSFLGFLCLAAAKLWIPSFVNRAWCMAGLWSIWMMVSGAGGRDVFPREPAFIS